LSAILQSSDTALQSLERAKEICQDSLPSEINDALEAIRTVVLCANHQKRIIDDTLTMSKLDSRLLLVTPVDTQPVEVVEKVMKMFENDFNHNEITPLLVVHPSYGASKINWVKADPSRFTQVLVNLLTNGTSLQFIVNFSNQIYCWESSS
jgi:signal transduction histidine kinase